jgi:hypothetical protein
MDAEPRDNFRKIMTRSLSEVQVQTLLQYLYSDRDDVRCATIQQTVTQQWQHEQLTQALTELAALDEVKEVRKAARDALQVMQSA